MGGLTEAPPAASSFTNLLVDRKSATVAHVIFETTKHFPVEERVFPHLRIRHSSRSVGAQIAEAWGKRRYVKHFLSKLTDAAAEVQETKHRIGIAASCQHVDSRPAARLRADWSEIGRLLQAMMWKAQLFSRPIAQPPEWPRRSDTTER